MSQLRNAGLVEEAKGIGGTTVTRPVREIVFIDVYEMVKLLEEGMLFHFHVNPKPCCLVGKTFIWL